MQLFFYSIVKIRILPSLFTLIFNAWAVITIQKIKLSCHIILPDAHKSFLVNKKPVLPGRRSLSQARLVPNVRKKYFYCLP
jgi:hypothetical protein